MDFKEIVAEQQRAFLDQLQIDDVIAEAVELLRRDIQNPSLNSEECHPDKFMLRANQAGIAFFKVGLFAAAERLYRTLAHLTVEYREQTGNWRHAGALFANTAGACAAQGNIDKALVELLRAAQDDVESYGADFDDSFAITDLLQEYFGAPVRAEALQLIHTINTDVALVDIENLKNYIQNREYAFLAYTHLALLHNNINAEFANEFSQLQIFSSLRSLCSLFEVVLKSLGGNMQDTFFPAMQSIYGNKSWWRDFDNTRQKIGAVRKTKRPIDDQLTDAISLKSSDAASRFWKSMLVAYIVRNYTTHQLEVNTALVQKYPQETLAHILHALVVGPNHA